MKHVVTMAMQYVAFVLFFGTSDYVLEGYAQPDKILYALQERCGKRAAEVFKKGWGANIVNTAKGQMIANYENHYSPRWNKCFYLEISTSYERENNKSRRVKSLTLFDLNDNKEYGTFVEAEFVAACQVRDRICNSEAEWRELAKAFMEE
jgi:hypothetical protein